MNAPVLMLAAISPRGVSCVPPTDVTNGELGGKSTLKAAHPSRLQLSLTPQSPDADRIVMPRTHAARQQTNIMRKAARHYARSSQTFLELHVHAIEVGGAECALLVAEADRVHQLGVFIVRQPAHPVHKRLDAACAHA